MIVPLAFAFCAGAGAIARAQFGHVVRDQVGIEGATLVVNLLGAFLLGLLTARSDGALLLAVGAGGIGAFTTYSTFVASCESMNGRHGKAATATYVVATIGLGIAAAELGLRLN